MHDGWENAMSNLNAIGLIAAILIGSYATFLFADRWIHDRGDVIATGLVRGIPMTTQHRWLVLINNWFTVVFSLIFFAFGVSAIFVGIAQNVGDPFVQKLAYVSALGFGGVCVIWIVLGGSWFVHYRTILRETKRD
jgi:ABC-type Fe3+ transport system permease subunit